MFYWVSLRFLATRLGGRRRSAAIAAVMAAAVLLALPATGTARVHGLRTGFTDIDSFQNASFENRALAFQRARAAGATYVRLTFS